MSREYDSANIVNLRNEIFAKTREYYQLVHVPKQEYNVGDRIPYAGRVFDEEEMVNLVDSSLEFWLTSGRYTAKFEKEFSEKVGVKHSLLVNSGSSANLIAFSALTSPKLGKRAIRKGDEVISVAAGFPTTVTPIVQFGAIPVFIDIDLPTYNISISQLEKAISSKTKAIMLAHTLGNPFNISEIMRICDENELWLIEDNCDALGSRYQVDGKWSFTGTFGDVATSSFYPPHHLTMGEGGAVYTNSTKLKLLAASFRDWGRDCWCESGRDDTCKKRFKWSLGELPKGYDHKYTYAHFGYNLKASDMQAAIGCAQLDKLEYFGQRRRKNFLAYKDGLRGLDDFFIFPEPQEKSDPSWFGYMLTLRDGVPFSRTEIVTYLESLGIQTRMLFAGNLLRHPCFDELRNTCGAFRAMDLTMTDKVMNDGFWLGVYPGLQRPMIDRIISSIHRFVEKY